jgi:N-acetylneuraminic acid mutarotase
VTAHPAGRPGDGSRAGVVSCLVFCCLAFCVVGGPSSAAPPSLDQRIADRRAIEEIFWRHRIWPAENNRPKPPLAEILPDAAIRERVLDDQARSKALERFWGDVITPDRIGEETARMASSTRDPATLRELFAALGNDPVRIGEALARPALADRLLRSRYTSDVRLQAAARERAESAIAGAGRAGVLRTSGALYEETTWTTQSPGPADAAVRGRGRVPVESTGDWDRLAARLAGWFGLHPARGRAGDHRRARAHVASPDWIDRLPIETVSPLQETDDRFFVATVLRKEPGSVTLGIASWPKRGFEEWWRDVREDMMREAAAEAARTAAGPSAPQPVGPDHGTVPVITGAACTDDQWSAIAAGQTPEERDSHTAVWTGTEMIVWGGSGVAGALDTGGRYRPATDTWTPTPVDAATPAARWNHTAVWTGTEMIVWGGYSGADDTSTGGRYNPATGEWTATSTGAGVPAIRESHTAIWTGAEMIVWGGESIALGYMDSGAGYAPLSDTWTALPAAGAPAPRGHHTAVWTGTEMIVWGGLAEDNQGNTFFLDTGGRYNPATGQWTATSLGANHPLARGDQTAVWTGTEMIVWGGSGAQGLLDSGARYAPSPESWNPTSTASGVPAARYLHTAIWDGSRMIVWGGYSGTGYVNSGGRYSPAGDSWSATSGGPGTPAGRGFHTAVWTGTEMIVWGGYYYNGSDHELSTGARYDPGADRWTPTADWADPRRLHTAVWTGAEMIVWGGEQARPPAPVRILNSGGRYVPATDTWTSTSVDAGVPAAREYHTAVWTGTGMIVWGGYAPPATEFNSGSRYDPASDTWSPTSTVAGVPVARDSHTAVWTGTVMIVWGGWNGLDAFATGGRYDPLADAWAATAAGPQKRYAHTAVWTGTEMIVWGGSTRTGGGTISRLNSGGRYVPATDGWTATPADGTVPAAREDHTAVWTGTEMIVWGGRDGATFFDTGARLVPGSSTWSATATGLGVPPARAGHTAVWTGTDMIVWGGSVTDAAGEHFLDGGGRYDPAADAWTAIASGGAPSPRKDQTAIWTGTGMLLWGGDDAASSLATGGDYCASGCPLAAPVGSPLLSLSGTGGATTLSWTALTSATGYDLVRGGLLLLRASGGDFAAATQACVANDTPDTTLPDAAVPAAGDGFWFLVRGTSCGGNGTYDSGAPGQAGSRDAGIDASAGACP